MDKIQSTSAIQYNVPLKRQEAITYRRQVSDGIDLIDIRRNNNVNTNKINSSQKPSSRHNNVQKRPVYQDRYEFSKSGKQDLSARERLELKRRKKLFKILGAEILAGAGLISKLLVGTPVSGSEFEVNAQPLTTTLESEDNILETTQPENVYIEVNSDGQVELAHYKSDVKLEEKNLSEEEIKPSEDTSIVYTQQMIEKANEILDGNERLKSSFDEMVNTVDKFTDQLGEDGYQLIKSRVEALGDDKITVQDVIKVLTIETHGNIYEDGQIIKSNAGAIGPYQLTSATVSDINDREGFKGTENELDIYDPYDNLDACIYQLKFLFDKNTKEIGNGKKLPSGTDVKRGMAWRYHDGAYATKYSTYGKQYVVDFDRLSEVEEYPELVEYMDYLLSGEVVNPNIEII